MASAQLDFIEEQLDKNGDLFQLYDKLYKGMIKANQVDPPDLPLSTDLIVVDSQGNPMFDENGEPIINLEKKAEVDRLSEDYATILRKNSAYLFANSILSVIGGGAGGGSASGGFVSRSGDTMKGSLSAWYGFDAGANGTKIFDVAVNADNKSIATVYGSLHVNEGIVCSGVANLEGGISFGAVKVIEFVNNEFKISHENIAISGNVSISDGILSLGSVTINDSGVFFNSNEYYHAGNSNDSLVDWTMHDATVSGTLSVDGDALIDGFVSSNNGFTFSVDASRLLYSEIVESIGVDGVAAKTARTVLSGDLRIVNGFGIKFDNDYIVHVRNSNVVSFSAPGMILNLGDSDNGHFTKWISLQSDLREVTGNFSVITKEGAGNFVNGIRAQCAVNGSEVLASFRDSQEGAGVVFQKQIRFGSISGPSISQETANHVNFQIPYINGDVAGSPVERIGMSMSFQKTTSSFSNKALDWSATLHFATDGEFFAFDKPVESDYFSIKSEKYHTRLIEDALFFDDGKFIEGIVDGIRYSGNSYFDGHVSSPSFASGFAGYGWSVRHDVTNGGFHATYDSLTVRKKMRVYELEVQKIYGTNGSLWVSDSCSGDEVIAL